MGSERGTGTTPRPIALGVGHANTEAIPKRSKQCKLVARDACICRTACSTYSVEGCRPLAVAVADPAS